MIAKKIKWIAGLIAVAAITGSCKKDFLDVFPNDALSDATVWTDLQFANRFLNNIYGTLPNGFARADQGVANGWARGMSMFAMATDDAEANNLAASTHTVNQGVIPTTWGYAEDMWVQHYALIRKCNIMLEKIDGVPGDASVKSRMKGEAQFLRAFAYEELIKCFGGVPLMLSAGTPDEAIIARSTYAQCVAQIVKDCDEAAAALPVNYTAANLGRASKAAALALKSRVLLYAASPLNNPGNEVTRWQAAADAAKAVMAYGPPPGTNDYGLHPGLLQNLSRQGRQ